MSKLEDEAPHAISSQERYDHTSHVQRMGAADDLDEALADQQPQQHRGGLIAIKSLLSRDPCIHANVAIEMIDAMLAQQHAAEPVTALINRLEQLAHRKGELWERCQGKLWPQAESEEFTGLRDTLIPRIRRELAATLSTSRQQTTKQGARGGTDWGETPRVQHPTNQSQPATTRHQWGCRANAFGECNMGCTDQAQHTPVPILAPSVEAIMALADAYAEARACEVTATTDDDLCGEERAALMGAVVAAVNTTRQAVAPVAQASMPFCRLEWLIGETVTAEQVVEMSKQGIQLYAGHAPIFTPLTESQLASACLRFRHDFGLLSESDRQALIAQAKDWDQALRGAREINITGPGVSCPKAAL
jgi:hypothetical protein